MVRRAVMPAGKRSEVLEGGGGRCGRGGREEESAGGGGAGKESVGAGEEGGAWM